MEFNFEILRDFVRHCPASPPIKRLRLSLFDRYRYAEDYENIYKLITDLGGIIK